MDGMRYRGRPTFWKTIGAAALAAAALAGVTPPAGAGQGTPPDNPGRGLVWDGLAPGRAEHRCLGLFEIRGRADEVLGCTHGPDPAPAGVDVRVPVEAGTLAGTAAALPMPAPGPGTNGDGIACTGDGTSGYRVEAIYATAGGTDRYGEIAPLIQTSYAPFVEWQYRMSAVETGGEVHVPFVTAASSTSGCSVIVRHEALSTTADDSFSNTMTELKARGYTRADRRYMVWMDSNVLCGVGSLFGDSRAGQDNPNNGSSSAYARVDTGCWGYAEGHEIMHNLGGVQPDAPNATPGFHCRDENDDMCYDDDGTGPVVMQSACGTRDGRLFDCNHNDYFLAGVPASGSYLATHWNTYNSRFLVRGPLGLPTNVAPVVDAGPNRSVQLGQQAALDGTVTDDALPTGAVVTQTWAKATGLGTVTFAAPGSVDTTASFSAAGTYTLSLTASDSQLSASDTMTVTVTDASVTETFSGSLSRKVRSITHSFASAAGGMTVTVNGPSTKTITATLYAPSGAVLLQSSVTGTRTFAVTGPVAGTYRLVMSGAGGSYTATVQHLR